MEIWTIDRLEGDWAVCQGPGQRREIPRSQLPGEAREGDCLRLREGRWEIDREETRRRREKAWARTQKLLSKK